MTEPIGAGGSALEGGRKHPSGLRLGSLLVIPLVFLATGAVVRSIAGPFWLGPNFDPDYAYLINGQRLAAGLSVGHIDHPGTPVQLLAAGIMRLHESSAPALARDVLVRPEHYLTQLAGVLAILVSGALLLVGVAMFRFSGSVVLALLAQTGPFLSGGVLARETYRANPEPALVCLALVLMSGLLFFEARRRRFEVLYAVGAGLVVGLGIACKLTFAPMLLLPLLCFTGKRAKLILIVSSILAFVLATLPILDVYPYLGRWIIGLVTHKGAYGSGNAGFMSARSALTGFRTLMNSAPMFLVGVVVGAAALIWRLLRRRHEGIETERAPESRVLLALLCAGLASAVIVLKHPESRYMIGSLALTGSVISLSLGLLLRSGVRLRSRAGYVATAFLGTIALGQFFNFVTELRALKTWRDQATRIDTTVKTTLADCAVVCLYRCSSPAFALSFGTHYGHGEDLRPALARIYPRFLEIWNVPGDWTGALKWNEIFEHHPCVLLRSSQDAEALRREAGLKATPLVSGAESLYLLTHERP